VRIESVTSTSVTLSSGATAISNASILPVRICTLVDAIKKSTNGYDEVYEYDFEVEDLVDIEPDVPTQYIVGDLYYDETLAETGRVDRNYQKVLDRVDFDLGRIAIRSPSRYSRMASVHRVVLTTAQEVWFYREFLYRRAGRYEMFWAPTFEQNLRVVTTGAIGSTIRVENDGYQDYEAREHLAFQGPDKAWYIRQVTASADAGGGRLDLTLDASLGLDAATLLRVCYLSQYRLDTDSVELRWVGNGVVVSDYALIQSAGGLENETMLGESTIWPDVAAYSLLQKTKLRVGDRQKTLDTGLTWEVESLGPTVWKIVVADVATIASLPTTNVSETELVLGAVDSSLPALYLGAGVWTTAPRPISAWSDRFTGNEQDGDLISYTPTGVIYRYASAIGEYFRLGYGTNFTLLRKLDGDVLPQNETPVFTETTSGGGSINLVTVSGKNYVQFSSGTGVSRTAYAGIASPSFTASTKFHCAGYSYLASLIVSGATDRLNGLGLHVRNSNKIMAWMGPSQTLGNGWTVNSYTVRRLKQVSAANETWLECISIGNVTSTETGGILLFANHEAAPISFIPGPDLQNGSGTYLRFGDADSVTSGGVLYARSWKFCTYT